MYNIENYNLGSLEMSTKTVDISEAKDQLPELVSLVLQGNEIIISEGNKPLARIVPVTESKQTRVAGLNRGKVWVSEDFDEPLSEDFWTGTK